MIDLVHGEPIRFGAERQRGVVMGADGQLRLVEVADVGEDAILVHDASATTRAWRSPSPGSAPTTTRRPRSACSARSTARSTPSPSGAASGCSIGYRRYVRSRPVTVAVREHHLWSACPPEADERHGSCEPGVTDPEVSAPVEALIAVVVALGAVRRPRLVVRRAPAGTAVRRRPPPSSGAPAAATPVAGTAQDGDPLGRRLRDRRPGWPWATAATTSVPAAGPDQRRVQRGHVTGQYDSATYTAVERLQTERSCSSTASSVGRRRCPSASGPTRRRSSSAPPRPRRRSRLWGFPLRRCRPSPTPRRCRPTRARAGVVYERRPSASGPSTRTSRSSGRGWSRAASTATSSPGSTRSTAGPSSRRRGTAGRSCR